MRQGVLNMGIADQGHDGHFQSTVFVLHFGDDGLSFTSVNDRTCILSPYLRFGLQAKAMGRQFGAQELETKDV